jgi:hypothetical protein
VRGLDRPGAGPNARPRPPPTWASREPRGMPTCCTSCASLSQHVHPPTKTDEFGMHHTPRLTAVCAIPSRLVLPTMPAVGPMARTELLALPTLPAAGPRAPDGTTCTTTAYSLCSGQGKRHFQYEQTHRQTCGNERVGGANKRHTHRRGPSRKQSKIISGTCRLVYVAQDTVE